MSGVVEVQNLRRVFRAYRKQPGFWGAVRGLWGREYTQVEAAKNVSFTLSAGELVGFLGPNGAGKTTVLKMLSGLIVPTSGLVKVAGFDPKLRQNAYRKVFSLVMGQKNQLWWDLPALESFQLIRHIYGIAKPDYLSRLEELVSLLQVGHRLNVMVRELSLGERMKMELIAALLHAPQILFLDEPTIGLDLLSQKTIREFLRNYNKSHQVTILLTSHYMRDIEDLCSRVILMNRGEKIYDGPLAQLPVHKPPYKVLRFYSPLEENAFFQEPYHSLRAYFVGRKGNEYLLKVPKTALGEVMEQIVRMGLDDLSLEEPSLEDNIHAYFQSLQQASS